MYVSAPQRQPPKASSPPRKGAGLAPDLQSRPRTRLSLSLSLSFSVSLSPSLSLSLVGIFGRPLFRVPLIVSLYVFTSPYLVKCLNINKAK